MKTVRLYDQDPYRNNFNAKVIANKRGWLALDQSAFYPEGGGQPADQGWLQGERVTDTRLDACGLIWHQVELQAEVGSLVEGRLDWLRRYDHMQQHTGQHVLSRACLQLFQAETVGFHLGREEVTIDLAADQPLTAEMIGQAETLANALLRSGNPVYGRWVAAADLPTSSLHKLPPQTESVRLVEIADFDLCPCSGTHVRNLGEVGLLKILRTEQKRGHCRLVFKAGQRAYQDYAQKHEQVLGISRLLSEPVPGVEQAVSRLWTKLEDLGRQCKDLRKEKLILQAEHYLPQVQSIGEFDFIICELDMDVEDAKFIASYLTVQHSLSVAFGLMGEPYRLLLNLGGNSAFKAGALLKGILAKYGGRGGGTDSSAQGAVAATEGALAFQELRQALAAGRQG